MFFATLFTIFRARKQAKCPRAEEWIKKMRYIYTKEYYLAIKKNKIMLCAATWMGLEVVSVVSRTQKDKYHKMAFICGI